jgi:hypothetical protein
VDRSAHSPAIWTPGIDYRERSANHRSGRVYGVSVPHQFRHTYATEMLRSGVSFPVLMKLLGHVDPGMTMRYVDVALTDLEREFRLTRSKPRHLAPQPKTSTAPVRTGIDGLIDSLVVAQHVMEMFRCSLPNGNALMRAVVSSDSPSTLSRS